VNCYFIHEQKKRSAAPDEPHRAGTPTIMQNHNSISRAPETLLFLAHVDAARRLTGGIEATPELINAMTRANAAAGTRLGFDGKPRGPIRRDRVH
jgi:hypothetical protein